MKRLPLFVLSSSLLLAIACQQPRPIEPPFGEGEGEGEGEGGEFPACDVRGTAAVTFTRDEGTTLAPTSPLTGTVYTYGLVALGNGVLVAEHAGDFLRSRDHGCTWTVIGAAPTSIMRMVAGGGRVYAWADNNRQLARIDDDDTITVLEPPGIGVLKGAHVHADGRLTLALDATLVSSTDFGATFDRGTVPALVGDDANLVYRAIFAGKDGDHVVIGAASVGARVSFDGGRSWTASTGLSVSGRANLFEGSFSPTNDDVLWAMGLDIDESLATPNTSKHIYRSTDGGLTFSKVLTEGGDVVLVNGPTMAASPTNDNVFYFVFGTYFQGFGTDLYRVVADGTFTRTHNDNHDISAIAFAPDDDDTMYLGLVHEVITAAPTR